MSYSEHKNDICKTVENRAEEIMRSRNVTGRIKASPLNKKKSRAYDVLHLTLINIFITVGYTLESFISNTFVAKFKPIFVSTGRQYAKFRLSDSAGPKIQPGCAFCGARTRVSGSGKTIRMFHVSAAGLCTMPERYWRWSGVGLVFKIFFLYLQSPPT